MHFKWLFNTQCLICKILVEIIGAMRAQRELHEKCAVELETRSVDRSPEDCFFISSLSDIATDSKLRVKSNFGCATNSR